MDTSTKTLANTAIQTCVHMATITPKNMANNTLMRMVTKVSLGTKKYVLKGVVADTESGEVDLGAEEDLRTDVEEVEGIGHPDVEGVEGIGHPGVERVGERGHLVVERAKESAVDPEIVPAEERVVPIKRRVVPRASLEAKKGVIHITTRVLPWEHLMDTHLLNQRLCKNI